MRWFIISCCLLASLRLHAQTDEAVAKESEDSLRYEYRVARYRKNWAALIPTQAIVQNAGNMGLFSAGFGWTYGKHRHWESNLMWGFIPKYKSSHAKLTMTMKGTYIPFYVSLKHGWIVEPLSCGMYVNTVFGHEFWSQQPGRYPDKYYEMLSTKFRLNAFAGQRITKQIPYNKYKFLKSVTFFYEVSTCDLYVRAMIQDRAVKIQDILGLSLGLKFQFI